MNRENATGTTHENKNKWDKLMRLTVDSANGDHVKINLPLMAVKALAGTGAMEATINCGTDIKIDWSLVMEQIEQGACGTLLEVTSANGDNVSITVE